MLCRVPPASVNPAPWRLASWGIFRITSRLFTRVCLLQGRRKCQLQGRHIGDGLASVGRGGPVGCSWPGDTGAAHLSDRQSNLRNHHGLWRVESPDIGDSGRYYAVADGHRVEERRWRRRVAKRTR